MSNASSKGFFQGDKVIWVVYFFLCIISLVEVYSAASTLAYKSGNYWEPLFKQAVFLSIGFVAMWVVHRIDFRYFRLVPVLLGPVFLVVLLLTMLFATKVNGGARWVTIPLINFQFQPSEFVKGLVIVADALILQRMQQESGAHPRAFKFCLWVSLGFMLFIITENLSTAGIIFVCTIFMMFLGRVPMKQIGALLGCVALAVGLLVSVLLIVPKDTFQNLPGLHRAATWQGRLLKFAGSGDKQLTPEEFDLDKDAQIAHSRIAIVESDFIGKAPGNSDQRDHLSQAFSDFIFAIIIEEMGLQGAAVVILLYIILFYRAGRIAKNCRQNFPALLIMGLAFLIVFQAFINMCVAVGIFPVTGQPLPLISRGGSSILATSVYLGMMLSVSRYAAACKEEEAALADDDEIALVPAAPVA